MDWLESIRKPRHMVPAMVIGVPGELRNQLVDYLLMHGFEPEVHDGHSQAAMALKAQQRTKTLPAFIISGFHCGSGTNAASFLQQGLQQGVPFVAITNDPAQHDALSNLNTRLKISEKDLSDLIDPKKNNSETAVEFLSLLEKLRSETNDRSKY